MRLLYETACFSSALLQELHPFSAELAPGKTQSQRFQHMAKILLGVSAALMIVAAVLGFLSNGKADQLKKEKLAAVERTDALKREAEIAKTAQKSAEEDAAQVKAALQQSQAEVASAKSDLERARKETEDAKSKIAAVEVQLESIKESLKQQGFENVNDIAQLLASMKQSIEEEKAKAAESQTKLQESEQLVATLTARTKELQKEKESLQQYKESRERRLAAKGLEGQILAVNQAWNFVVLSIGDSAGVVPNAEMVVMRGGEAIAKVKITSVEKATSIADVIPSSSPRGVRVQPGDRVIYPGGQGS